MFDGNGYSLQYSKIYEDFIFIFMQQHYYTFCTQQRHGDNNVDVENHDQMSVVVVVVFLWLKIIVFEATVLLEQPALKF